MLDLIYVVTMVLFFCLMLLYVAGCDRLGQATDGDRAEEHAS